jgi:hypothetical protein
MGLLVYVLFFLTVLCTKKLRTNPYFVLALTLSLCDCQFLLITVLYTTPSLMLMQVIGEIYFEGKFKVAKLTFFLIQVAVT